MAVQKCSITKDSCKLKLAAWVSRVCSGAQLKDWHLTAGCSVMVKALILS